MEVVKKTGDYTIYQKSSKRYAVKGSDLKWIGGDEKVKILVAEKLLKVAAPKPKPAEVVEDAPAEAPAEEAKEEAAE